MDELNLLWQSPDGSLLRWADMDLLSICSLQVRDDLVLHPTSSIGQVLNLDYLELLLLIGGHTIGPSYGFHLHNGKDAVRTIKKNAREGIINEVSPRYSESTHIWHPLCFAKNGE